MRSISVFRKEKFMRLVGVAIVKYMSCHSERKSLTKKRGEEEWPSWVCLSNGPVYFFLVGRTEARDGLNLLQDEHMVFSVFQPME